MVSKLIAQVLGSVLGRWILGGVVALLLGWAAIAWHNHKEGLKEEGMQECVQEINQATIDDLERALAEERSAVAELRANLAAVAIANEEAEMRKEELSRQLASLRGMMEQQRKNDETYRAWSDTPLPDGVADRLRQAAGSSPSDSN